ncbi:GNAT family N-acetyltransferase [Olivibacter sitiensis]|uniref:GNAT family N-acetyltransferase n=1 Tax=Olivibacter sitiensis TaxID=376470 RepID=UPI00048A2BBB|nr:GNAT family N-acetyltransferase [Olivibacter sitiensis]
MKNLKNQEVILRKLSIEEAEIFNDIHYRPVLYGKIDCDNYAQEDNAIDFTKRMLWLCKFIYTIRLKDKPQEIIGTCTLYNWDKESKSVHFGGSLQPKYWGNGFMAAALSQMLELAKYCLGAKQIKINIKPENEQACRMAYKLGFSIHRQASDCTILRRKIDVKPFDGALIKHNNMNKNLQQAG